MSFKKSTEAVCPRCNKGYNSNVNPGIITKCPNEDCKAILAPVFDGEGNLETLIYTGDSYDNDGVSVKRIDWYNIDVRKINWSDDKDINQIFNNKDYHLEDRNNNKKEIDPVKTNGYFPEINGLLKEPLGTYAALLVLVQILWLFNTVISLVIYRIFRGDMFERTFRMVFIVLILILSSGIPIAMVQNIRNQRIKLFVIIGTLLLFVYNLLQYLNIINLYRYYY